MTQSSGSGVPTAAWAQRRPRTAAALMAAASAVLGVACELLISVAVGLDTELRAIDIAALSPFLIVGTGAAIRRSPAVAVVTAAATAAACSFLVVIPATLFDLNTGSAIPTLFVTAGAATGTAVAARGPWVTAIATACAAAGTLAAAIYSLTGEESMPFLDFGAFFTVPACVAAGIAAVFPSPQALLDITQHGRRAGDTKDPAAAGVCQRRCAGPDARRVPALMGVPAPCSRRVS